MRGEPPARIAVPVVSIGELSLGVLAATASTRAQRLETLRRAEALGPLPISHRVASAWAALGNRHRRGIPVVAHDGDYDDVPGLAVIRV